MFKHIAVLAAALVSSNLAIAQSIANQADSNPASKAHHFGAIELNNVDFKDGLIHSGMLKLNNSKVNQSTIVNGILDANNAELNNVTINGSGLLTNVNLFGPTTINGQLQATNSNFNGIVTVYGYLNGQASNFKKLITVDGVNTIFTNCTLQDIVIKNAEPNLVQHLTLKGTKVLGDVTFESGKGVISSDEASSITGKVKGAQGQ